MLQEAFQRGRQGALAHFKLAGLPQTAPLSAAQTAATAMPPLQPKTLSPAAPVAAHASKSNILG
jgi:hypothetical protein